MAKITTEVLLCAAIIIFTIIAIFVYISSGSGVLFYALFVITTAIMVYTWYRISYAENAVEPRATTKTISKRATRNTKNKRRKSR